MELKNSPLEQPSQLDKYNKPNPLGGDVIECTFWYKKDIITNYSDIFFLFGDNQKKFNELKDTVAHTLAGQDINKTGAECQKPKILDIDRIFHQELYKEKTSQYQIIEEKKKDILNPSSSLHQENRLRMINFLADRNKTTYKAVKHNGENQAEALDGSYKKTTLGVVSCGFRTKKEAIEDINFIFDVAKKVIENGYTVVIPVQKQKDGSYRCSIGTGNAQKNGRQTPDFSSDDVTHYIDQKIQELKEHARQIRERKSSSLEPNSTQNTHQNSVLETRSILQEKSV